jgi:hypothetical protein
VAVVTTCRAVSAVGEPPELPLSAGLDPAATPPLPPELLDDEPGPEQATSNAIASSTNAVLSGRFTARTLGR